jgi:outer membrane protein W
MNIKNSLTAWVAGISLSFTALSASPVTAEEFGRFGIGARLYNFETGTADMGEVDVAFDSAYTADMSLTWRFMDNLSLEFSGTTFSHEIDTKYDDRSGYVGELTQTPLFMTLRYEQQVHESDLYLYFGIGAAYFINDLDFKKRSFPDPFFGANYNNIEIDDSLAFTLSIGAEYRFMEKYALCGDIRLISGQTNFTIDYPDGTIGKEDIGMTSSMFGIGIKYYF